METVQPEKMQPFEKELEEIPDISPPASKNPKSPENSKDCKRGARRKHFSNEAVVNLTNSQPLLKKLKAACEKSESSAKKPSSSDAAPDLTGQISYTVMQNSSRRLKGAVSFGTSMKQKPIIALEGFLRVYQNLRVQVVVRCLEHQAFRI
ncbi:uncharacterized protein LOC128352035 isoform X1 [Hemicordylus capensis]|uniref:uncharacterized protein LOC128352035 isoform X1 n=1 Tax=Hemicordylus capensis TaxID=884348 RepID=UPI0023022CFF|nr:uncharacterized protein LOC128352035 isoform X1 [Hemicordylus capensis]XP_053168168.1 uncharacterized protein LOC128352035 isoform X1 [Hemicordylus capensis]XP_053168169.1 uncharacterized protein LOC128352035 isoform X1 [Hemicordylus capensis]